MYDQSVEPYDTSRSKKVFALGVILILLSFALCLPLNFAQADDTPIHAGEEDASVPAVNPWPDIFPDSQADDKVLSRYVIVERAGKRFPMGINWVNSFNPGDKIHVYLMVNPLSSISAASSQIWMEVRDFIKEDGHITGTSSDTTSYIPAENIHLNGRPWTRFEGYDNQFITKDGKTLPIINVKYNSGDDFIFKNLQHRQYIDMTFTVPEVYGSFSIMTSSATKGYPASTASWFNFNGHETHVLFHFVDDAAYRRATQLTGDSSTSYPRRSAGDPVYSNKAFVDLKLHDLIEPVKENSFFSLLKFWGNVTPLLPKNAVSDSDEKKLETHNLDLSDRVTLDNFTTPHLSLAELEARAASIPGYFYIPDTHDVDLPVSDDDQGNSVFSLGLDGDTLLDTKHYYFGLKAIPKLLDITKTDDKQTALKGAHFSLYAVEDTGEILLTDKLSSDELGKVSSSEDFDYAQLIKALQGAEGTQELKGHHGYLYQNKYYLLNPGKYKLVETQAPAGYQKAEPLSFSVEPLQDINTQDLSAKAEAHELYTSPDHKVKIVVQNTVAATEPSKPQTPTPGNTSPVPGTHSPVSAEVPKLPHYQDKLRALPATGERSALPLGVLIMSCGAGLLGFAARKYLKAKGLA